MSWIEIKKQKVMNNRVYVSPTKSMSIIIEEDRRCDEIEAEVEIIIKIRRLIENGMD